MQYKYETHLHSFPASFCAKATLTQSLEYYKKQGYDGVFLTNHFVNAGVSCADRSAPIEEQLDFFCSHYLKGLQEAYNIGIKLFFGFELTYHDGTDFLIYGLSPEWVCEHPEILNMQIYDLFDFLHFHKAFIVQAHPFRQRPQNEHIELFPDKTDGIEVINSCNNSFENKIAKTFAGQYGLFELAGSDNHVASAQKNLAGIITKTPINSEEDFIRIIKEKKYKLFG